MSGAVTDIRDVLGLDGHASGPRQPPLKKQKTFEKRPDGITRELYALLGDGVPPINLVEQQQKFKKPKIFRITPWEWKEFTNEARNDGLKLAHWAQKTTDEDAKPFYQFAKYNIKIDILEYTDGEYETVLRDDDWTREETDYLFNLVREYDLRWMVISDRYEWEGKERSMEDIKSRYYSICRSVMEIRTPPGLMNEEETKLYNALKYDKAQEIERKRIANLQLYRTPAEVEHEAHLIAELKRIHDSHQNLLEEREELFNRLDFPQSTGSIAAYTGSQGLAQLASSLLATDRNKKRKSIAAGGPGTANGDGTTSPTVTRNDSISQHEMKASSSHHHRDSTVSAAGAAGAANKDKKQAVVRTLTKAEEIQYGVTHHEKLTSGVYARSQKMNTPKGASYGTKSLPILTELGVPPVLTMPTTRVVAKYEQLTQEIALLLDVRKAVEKIDQETKVFKAQEAIGEGHGGIKRSASVMSDVSKSSKKPKKEK